MIHITAQMRVLVAIEPVDGRKGIDSLVRALFASWAENAEASLRRQQAAPKDGWLLLETHEWASSAPMSEKPDMGHPDLLVRCGPPACPALLLKKVV
jgi:hypothetical protein